MEAELAAAGTGSPLDPAPEVDPATVTDRGTVTGNSTFIDNSTVTIDSSTVTDPTTADGSDRDELWKKPSAYGRNGLRGA